MRNLIVAFAVILSGCASMRAPDFATGSPGQGVAGISGDSYVAVSDLLVTGRGPKFEDVQGYPVKGLVLLDRTSGNRNKKVCNAFVNLARIEVAERMGIPRERVAPTYWLVGDDRLVSTRECDGLLANYDYDVAAIYRQMLGKAGEKGPLLAAVSESGQLAFINLSKANNRQIAKFVPTWAAAMQSYNMTDVTVRGPKWWERVCGVFGNKTAAQFAPGETITVTEGGGSPRLQLATNVIKAVVIDNIPFGGTFSTLSKDVCKAV